MSTGYMSVQALSRYIGGAWASGLRVDICTWAVTHMGVGKWYEVWDCEGVVNPTEPQSKGI